MAHRVRGALHQTLKQTHPHPGDGDHIMSTSFSTVSDFGFRLSSHKSATFRGGGGHFGGRVARSATRQDLLHLSSPSLLLHRHHLKPETRDQNPKFRRLFFCDESADSKGSFAQTLGGQPQNPKPQTLNPKPLNHHAESLNPQTKTLNTEAYTLNRKVQAPNPTP